MRSTAQTAAIPKERTLSIKQKASPGLSCERLGLTLFYHITLTLFNQSNE